MKHRWKSFTALIAATLFTFTIIIAAFPVFPKTVLYLRRYQTKYHTASKLLDPIYQLAGLFMSDQLPRYQLAIASADIQAMLQALPQHQNDKLTPQHKLKAPAQLVYQGQQLAGQIWIRGELSTNWWYPKKSFKLALDQPFTYFEETNLFYSNTTFNLILPEERGFIDEAAALILGQKMGLVVPQFHYAYLSINGQSQGVYFVLEDFTPEFLHRLNLGSQLTVYAEEKFDLTASLYSPEGKWKILATTTEPTFEPIDQLKQIYALEDDQEFFDQIAQIFDLDKLLTWSALSLILGDKHQEDFHNNRLIFNHQTNKFFFVPNDVQIRPPDEINFDQQYTTENTLLVRVLKHPDWLKYRHQIVLDTINSGKLADMLSQLANLDQSIRPAIFKDANKYPPSFSYLWDIRYKFDFLKKNSQVLINALP